MKKMIIFDCFGTLIEPPENMAYKKLLLNLNLDLSDMYLNLIKQNNFNWHDIAIKQGFNEKDANNMIAEFKSSIKRENEQVELYPNTLEILNLLKEDYALILISNLAEGYIPCVETKLSDFIPNRFYSCCLNMKKPNPNIFEHALNCYEKKHTKIQNDNIYVLDDNLNNIKTANILGMNGVLIHSNNSDNNIMKAKNITDFYHFLK